MEKVGWFRRAGRRHGVALRRVFALEALEDRLTPSTFTVTDTSDNAADGSGASGSLRYCITQVNNDTSGGTDTIQFAPSLAGQTITLTAALPTLTNSVAVVGPGAAALTVSGDNQFGIFSLSGPVAVSLSGLTLADGLATRGAAVYDQNGTAATALTLTGLVFLDNQATADGGAVQASGDSTGGTVTVDQCTFSGNSDNQNGGAIDSPGATLSVSNSTFAGNTAGGDGGALAVGTGLVQITNSTFTGNTAGGDGGALASPYGASFTLLDSTVSGNTAGGGGGGIYNASGAELAVGNTIVAGNTAGSAPDLSSPGGFTDQGYNLFGTGVSSGGTGDVFSDNPGLTPLGNYGGPTPTRGLLPGSPAVGAGDPAQAGTPDQRGDSRGSSVDIGAYQTQGFSLTITQGQYQDTPVATDFATPLQVVLMDGDVPVQGAPITFTVEDGYSETPPATFSGSGTVTTAGDGTATAPALTAGTSAQGFSVVATDAGGDQATFYLFIDPGVVAGYQISGPEGAVAPGQDFTLDVTPVDAYGNDFPSGLGTVTFTSSDARATLPASFNFQTSESGDEDGADYLIDGFALNSSGAQTVTLVDAAHGVEAADSLVESGTPAVQIQGGGNQFANVGAPFAQSGSFSDPGSFDYTVSVNYGDGTPTQTLPYGEDDSFTLQHTYTQDGTFVVRVTVDDGYGNVGQASFYANVLLPGVTQKNIQGVPPGTTQTLTYAGASVTLTNDTSSPDPAFVLVAVVPKTAISTLENSSFLLSPSVQVTSYDVRAVNVDGGDSALVTLTYLSDNDVTPVLTYYNSTAGEQQLVRSDFYQVNTAAHTVTFELNATSTPTLPSTGGTVFSISVPIEPPPEGGSVFAVRADIETGTTAEQGEAAVLTQVGTTEVQEAGYVLNEVGAQDAGLGAALAEAGNSSTGAGSGGGAGGAGGAGGSGGGVTGLSGSRAAAAVGGVNGGGGQSPDPGGAGGDGGPLADLPRATAPPIPAPAAVVTPATLPEAPVTPPPAGREGLSSGPPAAQNEGQGRAQADPGGGEREGVKALRALLGRLQAGAAAEDADIPPGQEGTPDAAGERLSDRLFDRWLAEKEEGPGQRADPRLLLAAATVLAGRVRRPSSARSMGDGGDGGDCG